MTTMEEALNRLFDDNPRHRIVFWYDAEREMREQFEELELPGVEKVEIRNNELALKYRILRKEPDRKFLLYHEGPQPKDLDNWLLDVQLAHTEFRADQVGLWLSELGLGFEFTASVREHRAFFTSAKRMAALKKITGKDDTPDSFEMKLLAVCADADHRIEEILLNLLDELARKGESRQKLIGRCELWNVLWGHVKAAYGYAPERPTLKDFALELFQSGYDRMLENRGSLNVDALVFLKRWRDSSRHRESFETLSEEAARGLSVERDLAQRDYRDLLDLDFFRDVDGRVLTSLIHEVEERTMTAADCAEAVRRRREGHWFGEYADLYGALHEASHFFQALEEADLSVKDLADGVRRYARSWYRVDQLYRRFSHYARRSGERSMLQTLTEKVENLYVNRFLLPLNDGWQKMLDGQASWKADGVIHQRGFYRHWVHPFTDSGKKLIVIISDALRYEVAQDLLTVIRSEDRYEASIEPMLSALPSFTQLGMAALLPHTELAFAGDEAGTVLADGQDTRGTINREKILQTRLGERGRAIRAGDFMNLNLAESRELLKSCDVLYVYHNRIDVTGGSTQTEDGLFEAAETAIAELVRLVKKLTGANANNILITADHGFLYQSGRLDESDFTDVTPEGAEILLRDRRFVLGRGLEPKPGLWDLTPEMLGLTGDVEVQLARSVKRLRLTGATIRFVHGGASLQEVVLPVVHINKKRKSDVSLVDVDIIRGTSGVITSGQLSATFYQMEPVTEKRKARRLRAGIYSATGELISDSHELDFDLESPEARERERTVRFILTKKADAFNGQEVFLWLEEAIPDTNRYREYRSERYTVRRAFTSDFDF